MQIRYTADVVLLAPGPLRVLLIQRRWDPYTGYWALPGGHVDDDAADARWQTVGDGLTQLAFDHDLIVSDALAFARGHGLI